MSGIQGIGVSTAAYSTAWVGRETRRSTVPGQASSGCAIVDTLDLSGEASTTDATEARTTAPAPAESTAQPIDPQRLSAVQRHMYSQTPDAAFFAGYTAAYAECAPLATADTSADDPSVGTLSDVLGSTQTELAALRGVSDADQQQYAALLARAYADGGINDPRGFLQSLSPSDLDIVRRMHGLADPIVPGTLSDEGATNLLLPEGYSVDLDRDGLDEVGVGKIMHFPPRDAPSEFTDAWFQATSEMGFGDYATHSMTFLLAFHPPTATANVGSPLPSNSLDSYRTVVDNYLDMLQHGPGFLAEGQYERDYPFFSRLHELLAGA